MFNIKKVEEHHAIIPSSSCRITKPLEGYEASIFEIVVKRYISFFMPDFKFLQINIQADIDSELFAASGRQILNEGWKAIEKYYQENEKTNDEDNNLAPLPKTSKGEKGLCKNIKLLKSNGC